MNDNTFNSVNEHCFDNVMKLTETHKVTTSEDIFDAHGNKLLAKGATINASMKERLVRHKLVKPLETTLSVENGVNNSSIVAEARQLFESMPPLVALMGKESEHVLEILKLVKLEPPAALLLTTSSQSREGMFRHNVLVTLVATSLAVHSKLAQNEKILVATAGLLHDIGEMYIDPKFFDPKRSLTPDEWKHIVAHPKVAQMALAELTKYPKLLIESIGNHHERIDGSGYPRQINGKELETPSRMLSMAEALSGILVQNGAPLTRACLALKCVPGEYPRELVSMISSLRRGYPDILNCNASELVASLDKTHSLTDRLVRAFTECQTITQENTLPKHASSFLSYATKRVDELHQAVKATGINECIAETLLEETPENREIWLEIDVISHEINWRMRDVARDLYIRLSNTAPELMPKFSALIQLLDKSFSLEQAATISNHTTS